MKKLATIAAVGAGLAMSAASSQAQITDVTSAGTGVTATGLNNLSLVTSEAVGYTGNGLLGALTSSVYSGVNADTIGGDTYVFQVSELAAATDDTASFTISGFAGTTYKVYQITPAGGLLVLSSYTVDANGTLHIDVNTQTPPAASGMTPGTTSTDLVIYDSATGAGSAPATIQDNYTADISNLAPVPEANTVIAGALMLLPLGIGAVRAIRKERVA